jgi:hypothetical protein
MAIKKIRQTGNAVLEKLIIRSRLIEIRRTSLGRRSRVLDHSAGAPNDVTREACGPHRARTWRQLFRARETTSVVRPPCLSRPLANPRAPREFDRHCLSYIARSPFVLIASSDAILRTATCTVRIGASRSATRLGKLPWYRSCTTACRGTAVSTSADNVQSLEAPFAPAGGNVCAIDTLRDSAVVRLVGLPPTLVTRASAVAVLPGLMSSGAEPRRIHRAAP